MLIHQSLFFIKLQPISKPSSLIECSKKTSAILVTEDHNVHGGLYGAVCESISLAKPCLVDNVSVQDTFGESGEPDELAEKYNISSSAILDKALKLYKRKIK